MTDSILMRWIATSHGTIWDVWGEPGIVGTLGMVEKEVASLSELGTVGTPRPKTGWRKQHGTVGTVGTPRTKTGWRKQLGTVGTVGTIWDVWGELGTVGTLGTIWDVWGELGILGGVAGKERV